MGRQRKGLCGQNSQEGSLPLFRSGGKLALIKRTRGRQNHKPAFGGEGGKRGSSTEGKDKNIQAKWATERAQMASLSQKTAWESRKNA